MAGDASDPAFLTRAFRGAHAVHTLLPYDPASPDYHGDQDRLGESIVAAVRAAGVRHVVALSSVGADVPAGTGFLTSLFRQEQRLRALADVHVLALRPGYFFESVAAAADVVREHGVNVDAIAGDVPIPMVATRDVGDAAARALVARDWSGFAVRELLGPRDLTYAEATRILGDALGRPDLGYVQLPGEEMAAILVQAGFAPQVAALHVEFAGALGDGTIRAQERSVAGTRSTTTPTGFEDVVGELMGVAAP